MTSLFYLPIFYLSFLATLLVVPPVVGADSVDSADLVSAEQIAENRAEKLAPPPSSYDRLRGADHPNIELGDERSLLAQMAQTAISLLIVLGLIFLVGKLVLPKLFNSELTSTGDKKRLKLVEKTSLDGRNSLFLVEVKGVGQYLLAGGGDRGVRLVANLDAKFSSFTSVVDDSVAEGNSKTFGTALKQFSVENSVETLEGEQ